MHRTARSCNCVTVMATMSVVVGPVQLVAPGDRVADGIHATCVACSRQYALLSQTALRSAAVVEGWLQTELLAGRDPVTV